MFQAYLIRCSASGKTYVGITGRSVRARWAEHVYNSRNRTNGNALYAAIAKHGAESFSIESVCCFRSWDDACASEPILIQQAGSIAPGGYNLMTGGNGRAVGFRPSAESIERSAAKHRGKPCHPNTRRRSSEFHKGHKKSEVTRAKMAASRLGRPMSVETKAKLSAYWERRRKAGDFETKQPYAHARKAASAHIAKIPYPLARWIGRAWKPSEEATA